MEPLTVILVIAAIFMLLEHVARDRQAAAFNANETS
jgi:hypothetical protein